MCLFIYEWHVDTVIFFYHRALHNTAGIKKLKILFSHKFIRLLIFNRTWKWFGNTLISVDISKFTQIPSALWIPWSVDLCLISANDVSLLHSYLTLCFHSVLFNHSSLLFSCFHAKITSSLKYDRLREEEKYDNHKYTMLTILSWSNYWFYRILAVYLSALPNSEKWIYSSWNQKRHVSV